MVINKDLKEGWLYNQFIYTLHYDVYLQTPNHETNPTEELNLARALNNHELIALS